MSMLLKRWLPALVCLLMLCSSAFAEADVSTPTDLLWEETEETLFARGYALLMRDTPVYEDAAMTSLMGTVTGQSPVYVFSRTEVDGAGRDVLGLRFLLLDEVKTGYVRASAMVSELTAEQLPAQGVICGGVTLYPLALKLSVDSDETDDNPATDPTEEPAEQTPAPTEEPAESTPAPAEEPAESTPAPTEGPAEPTPAPIEEPEEPTPAPTEEPAEPTPAPTEEPVEPTPAPTEEPAEPTPVPAKPTVVPTATPAPKPTASPIPPATDTDLEPAQPVAATPKPTEAPVPATVTDLDETDQVRSQPTLQAEQIADKKVKLSWDGNADSYVIMEKGKRLSVAVHGDASTGWYVTLSSVTYAVHTYTVVPVINGKQDDTRSLSAVITVVGMPPAPVLKVIQATSPDYTLKFTWSILNATYVDHYDLYEMGVTGGLVPVKQGIAKALRSCLLNDVTPGIHRYVLVAVTKGYPELVMTSNAADITSAAMWRTAPTTLTGAMASTIDTAVRLTWKPKYVAPVAWSIREDGIEVARADGAATSYVVNGVVPGIHMYTVVPMGANDEQGGTSIAAKVNVKCSWLDAAKMPTVKAAMNTKLDRAVNLTITVPYGGAAPWYVVYDNGRAIQRVKGGTVLKVTATLQDQALGVHHYTVQAENEAGQRGTMSAEVTYEVYPLSCAKVTGLKASLYGSNTGIVKLTWKSPYMLADQYRIICEEQVDGQYVHVFEEVVPVSSTYIASSVLPNGTYRFSVQPEQYTDGQLVQGERASVIFKVNIAWKKGPTIYITQVKTGSGIAKLLLTPGAIVRGAVLQLSVDYGPWLNVTVGLKEQVNGVTVECLRDRNVTLYGLAEEQQHSIRVCYLKDNEYSLITERLYEPMPACLFAVTGLKAVQSEEKELTVRWTPYAVDERQSFLVEAIRNRKVELSAVVTDSVCTLQVPNTGLYTIRVTPMMNGWSGDIKTASCTVFANYWKLAPVISRKQQTDWDELTIWFGAARDAEGYALFDNGVLVTSNVSIVIDGANSRMTITGLKGRHYYQIAAWQVIDGVKKYGTRSLKQTVTIGTVPELTPVTGLQVTMMDAPGKVLLSWSSDRGVAFRILTQDMVTGEIQEIDAQCEALTSGWQAELQLADGLQCLGVKPVMTKPDGSLAVGTPAWTDPVTVSLPGTERRTGVQAAQVEGTGYVNVIWQNPQGTAADVIHVLVDGQKMTSVTGAAATVTLQGLNVGIHEITLIAESHDYGMGKPSVPVEVQVFDPNAMMKPLNLKTSVLQDGQSVQLTWTDPGCADLFRVYALVNGEPMLVAEAAQSGVLLQNLGLGKYQVYVVPVSRLSEDLMKEGTASDQCNVSINSWQSADGLVYTTTDFATATITAYVGNVSALVVPETVGACTVTAIAASVFENCNTLHSITLPKTITKVGKRCFANCDHLSIMN